MLEGHGPSGPVMRSQLRSKDDLDDAIDVLDVSPRQTSTCCHVVLFASTSQHHPNLPTFEP